MASVRVYNLEGKEAKKITVSDEVFGAKKNDTLVHQVYTAIYANKRQSLAHTKNRGERAGSGKKPWKQKGTGRARVGSVRNPLWKKGGVAFGPRSDRNYSQKVNSKMKAKAISVVLSEKLRDDNLVVLENFEVKEKKTKNFAQVLENLKSTGTTLWVFTSEDKDLRRFSRNISKVENILVSQLNVFDMLNKKNLLLSEEAIKYLDEKYSQKTK